MKVDETLGERGSRYGEFKDNARVAQQLRQIIMDNAGPLSAVQIEALVLICNKLARIVNGDPNYEDSWHDIAGYATLVENDIRERKA